MPNKNCIKTEVILGITSVFLNVISIYRERFGGLKWILVFFLKIHDFNQFSHA